MIAMTHGNERRILIMVEVAVMMVVVMKLFWEREVARGRQVLRMSVNFLTIYGSATSLLAILGKDVFLMSSKHESYML